MMEMKDSCGLTTGFGLSPWQASLLSEPQPRYMGFLDRGMVEGIWVFSRSEDEGFVTF